MTVLLPITMCGFFANTNDWDIMSIPPTMTAGEKKNEKKSWVQETKPHESVPSMDTYRTSHQCWSRELQTAQISEMPAPWSEWGPGCEASVVRPAVIGGWAERRRQSFQSQFLQGQSRPSLEIIKASANVNESVRWTVLASNPLPSNPLLQLNYFFKLLSNVTSNFHDFL